MSLLLMPLPYPSPPHPTPPACRSCFWKQECPNAPQPDHWESKQMSGMPDAQVTGLGMRRIEKILASKSLGTCSCILPYNHHQGKKYRVQTPGTNIQINKKSCLIISSQHVPFLRWPELERHQEVLLLVVSSSSRLIYMGSAALPSSPKSHRPAHLYSPVGLRNIKRKQNDSL